MTEDNKEAPKYWFNTIVSFFFLFLLRVILCFYYVIDDCDESMNYYEPLHLLLYKYGLQTWEYSPEYGLRSYFYLLLHTPLAFLAKTIFNNKMAVFQSVQITLAIVSSICDVLLCRAVEKGTKSYSFARNLFFLILVNPLQHRAAISFLPSSFAMYCVTLAATGLLTDQPLVVPFLTSLSVIMGWPFSGLVFVPMCLTILPIAYKHKSFWLLIRFTLVTIVSTISLSMVLIMVDSTYFKRGVLAPLNIVLYNVLSEGKGPELYGIEPMSYYIKNLALNLGPIAVLLLLGIFMLLVFVLQRRKLEGKLSIVAIAASAAVWFLFMMLQPHKEERFMYPTLGLFSLIAAFGLTYVTVVIGFFKQVIIWGVRFVFIIALIFFLSRWLAIYDNHSAINSAYGAVRREMTLHEYLPTPDGSINVCTGKEWYRFPTHFALPSEYKGIPVRLRWIESGFDGLLPAYFPDGETVKDITSTIPKHMNDENLFEPTRITSIEHCHFIVESEVPDQSENSLIDEIGKQYRLVKIHWGVSLEKTPLIHRVLWFPGRKAFRIPYFALVNEELIKPQYTVG
ncbi:hypothetical protein PCE1_003083 [Barthelona sp. PCE]